MQLSSDQAAAPLQPPPPTPLCCLLSTGLLICKHFAVIPLPFNTNTKRHKDYAGNGFLQVFRNLTVFCLWKYFESQLAQFIELINISLPVFAVCLTSTVAQRAKFICTVVASFHWRSLLCPWIRNSRNKLTSNVHCDKALTISEWDFLTPEGNPRGAYREWRMATLAPWCVSQSQLWRVLGVP